jgi:hypothetical protein
MTRHDEGRGVAAASRVLGAIARRWWLIVGVVALVGVGTALTKASALTSPAYTESATVQIVVIPSGATSYGGAVGWAQAEVAAQHVTSALVSAEAGPAPFTLAFAQTGDTVTVTAHAATKADAERGVRAALAAIDAAVANGDLASAAGLSSDVQLGVVLTQTPTGAVVDQTAAQAAWRGIALRLALALALGIVLAGIAGALEARAHEGRSDAGEAPPAARGNT